MVLIFYFSFHSGLITNKMCVYKSIHLFSSFIFDSRFCFYLLTSFVNKSMKMPSKMLFNKDRHVSEVATRVTITKKGISLTLIVIRGHKLTQAFCVFHFTKHCRNNENKTGHTNKRRSLLTVVI